MFRERSGEKSPYQKLVDKATRSGRGAIGLVLKGFALWGLS